MRKGLLLGLAIGVILSGAVCVIALAGGDSTDPAAAYSSGSSSAQSGIWVSGTGEVTVIPDIAVLTLGVECEEATVQKAMDEAAEAMDQVMSKLLDRGIDDSDIQTKWFNVYPLTKWTESDETITRYEVTNAVSVTIRDVDATGDIIDAVAKAGGDQIRIQGVSFSTDDPSQYYTEALDEAVADATEKAKQLADLSDVKLGKPFYISEGSSYSSNYVYSDYEMISYEESGVPTTSISPGETEITLTVQMAFAIQ